MTPRRTGGAARVPIALEVRALDRGGLETMVVELARSLPEHGLDPVVICTRSGGASADLLRREGIAVEVLSSPDAASEIQAILERHGALVLNAHYSLAGIPAAAALGVPVVVTLHNAYAWDGDGIGDPIRAADPQVALYVAVSDFVARYDVARFALDRDKVVVVRNCVSRRDVDRSPARRAQARRRLGLADDAELVVHVARVERLKCQLATVAATVQLASARPRLRTWIVGAAGEDDYAALVARAIADAGLGDRLVATGARDDVDDLLAAADVVVLPSAVEGLSIAALEAVAAGVPCVLTRTGDAEFLLAGDGAAAAGAQSPVAAPDATHGGALIDGPWPPAETAAVTAWQELRVRAAAESPPHAAALADALRTILDDLPAHTAAAAARARQLAPVLAPERLVRDYAAVLLRVAARAAAERATTASARAAGASAELERTRTTIAALLERLSARQEAVAQQLAELRGEAVHELRAIRANQSIGHRLRRIARKLRDALQLR